MTPIRDIVNGFRMVRGWTENLPAGVITKPNDAQTITRFEDPIPADAFRRYQHSVVQMRIVAKDASADQLRAGRFAPPGEPSGFERQSPAMVAPIAIE